MQISDTDLFASQYEKMDEGTLYGHELMIEYTQCLDEGLCVQGYKALFETIDRMSPDEAREKLADGVFHLIRTLPTRTDFLFTEPNDYDAICALRDGGLCKAAAQVEGLRDRIAGAWYGRLIGCLLGKTLEGIRSEELLPLLRESGNYPMHRYVRSTDPTPHMLETFRYDLRHCVYADRIDCAPADDDTNYVVMAQTILERFGRGFTPEDVAGTWLNLQPRSAYFTAERVAYCNFARGILPPASAEYKNKYREYIGAQIRADYYGYICPGDPAQAAEYAFRDASVSHVKNGIYGAMFVAAMIAAAAVGEEPRAIVLQGLSAIPRTSRLYDRIQRVLRDHELGLPMEDQVADLRAEYDEHTSYGWCHVIPNAVIVTLALLYGEGDFARSICLAVQTGYDTDCNGATVGSIVGMLRGDAAIPPVWKAPLGGRLQTELVKLGTVDITSLIDKTMAHIGA